MQNISRSMRV